MKYHARFQTRLLSAVFTILSFSFSTISYSAPGNDLCANAVALTSTGTTCSNTAGTVVAATYTATLTDCGGSTPTYDVWYKFVAQAPNPTITLSAIGANFNTPRIQIFSGACGALVNVACSVSPALTVSAAGLTVGNTYFVRVYSLNGVAPATLGTFNICITYPAPDLCANAFQLTSGISCSNIDGTLTGTTYTAIATIGCGTANRNDVWYSFVAQTTNPTITLTTALANPQLQLFSGTCAALASVQCVAGTTLTAAGLTIGNTYLIRVYTSPNVAGTFSICVTDPAPGNDACASAFSLTSGTSCANTAGTLYAATATAGISAFCGATTSPDVWYSFIAQSTSPTIALSSMGSSLDNTPRLQLFNTNSCTIATLNANSNNCVSGTNQAALSLTPATALTIGNTYLVRVFSTTAMTNIASEWNFNICITDLPPANDDCSFATTLTSGLTCVNTAGTLYAATATAGISAFCGATTSPDVWYSFIAQSTSPTIALSSMGSNMDNTPRLQIFNTNSCTIATLNANSNNCVSGTNQAALSLTPATALTVGNTYLVRVFSTTAMTGTLATWNFNICITDSPPVNDACSGAISLTSATSCSNTAGTLYAATATAGISAFCGATTSPDVWYSFVAQSTSPTITLSSMGSNLDNTPRLQIFNPSSCTVATLNGNSNTCVSGTNQTTLSLTPVTALTIGNTYLVRVFSTTAMTGTLATWNFNICVTDPPPANDACSGVISLTSGSSCVTKAGTLYSATATAGISAFCGATTSPDVWYSFVAQSTSPTIALSNMGTNMALTPRLQIFNTNSCTVATLNANSNTCASGTNVTTLNLTPATVLTIGTTYLVRVFTNTAMTGTLATWYFDICITDPPANDACANAAVLTSGTSCVNTAGTLYAATATSGISAFCGSTTSADVWYSFVAQSTSPTIALSSMGTSMALTPRLQLFNTTSCTIATINANSNTCVSGTNVTALNLTPATALTIGNTYLVRVFTNSTITGTPIPWNFNICITDPPPVNDDCAGAISLTSHTTCTNTAGSVYGATNSGVSTTCGTAIYDVWYSFVAQTTNPTVTLSSVGSSFNSPNMELFSGTCAALTTVACGSTSITASGLTIGTTYYVRVFSAGGSAPASVANTGFNICVTDPAPDNNNCTGAISLTSGTVCITTAGSVYGATNSGVSTACGTAIYDVWYSFVAQTTNPTVTLSSVGASFNSPHLQLFSGTCGSLTSVACGTTSIAATGLIAGNTYYVRVFSTSGSAPTSVTNTGFNICVTDPSNDLCANAPLLNSALTCTNVPGTLAGATVSAPAVATACATAGGDVWYKFIAETAYPTITLSSMGTNMSTNPRIQLFSGTTCATLSNVGCVSGTSVTTLSLNALTVPGGAGLTVGGTYYIRIYSNTLAPAGVGWDFNICITDQTIGRIDYSKSYINVTKGLVGGTVDPGDTLEIRATFVVFSNGTDSLAYYDTLFANKGLRLVPGSIALRTNEGKIYKSFTDIFDTDAGWRLPSGSDTAIQINFGTNASNVARGKLKNTSKPSFYGSTCIVMATYRVVVYAGYNTKINFGGGAFTYRDTASGVLAKISFKKDSVMVYQSPGLCPNAVSVTNAVGGETNGTFGAPSGAPPLARNRGTTPFTPAYTYAIFQSANPQGPQDYDYGITNNTSAAFTKLQNWGKGDVSSPSYRVFTLWDIIGDHTGATNTAKGNPPCDTTLPVSATNPCGYMLVINSSYKADTAFQYTVANLCPNTYYEISAWMRNICYKCGCDSNGVGASGGGYIPFATADSSGVQPNLAFEINGTDYYTTGNVKYLGTTPTKSDTSNQWQKKGFTYLTGASETSFALTIRNNAPGGGGNDWALDDISVATCLPTMSFNPSTNPTTCKSDYLRIYDTIRSYFNNYIKYKWQHSTDGGLTWIDCVGVWASGTGTPTWNGTQWQYIGFYLVPPSDANLSNNGDKYRAIVATTPTNLSNTNCQVSDGTSIVTLNIIDCGVLLKTDFISFSGKVVTNHSHLAWTTSKEDESVHFNIEKSSDGLNFTYAGTVNGYNNYSSEINQYTFIDPADFTGNEWYRIVMINSIGKEKYSRIIQLSEKQIDFSLDNVLNPFSNELSFEVTTTSSAVIDVSLVDLFGKTVKHKNYIVYNGVNSLSIENTSGLPAGIYILQVKNKDIIINNKVLKK